MVFPQSQLKNQISYIQLLGIDFPSRVGPKAAISSGLEENGEGDHTGESWVKKGVVSMMKICVASVLLYRSVVATSLQLERLPPRVSQVCQVSCTAVHGNKDEMTRSYCLLLYWPSSPEVYSSGRQKGKTEQGAGASCCEYYHPRCKR